MGYGSAGRLAGLGRTTRVAWQAWLGVDSTGWAGRGDGGPPSSPFLPFFFLHLLLSLMSWSHVSASVLSILPSCSLMPVGCFNGPGQGRVARAAQRGQRGSDEADPCGCRALARTIWVFQTRGVVETCAREVWRLAGLRCRRGNLGRAEQDRETRQRLDGEASTAGRGGSGQRGYARVTAEACACGTLALQARGGDRIGRRRHRTVKP